MIDWQEKYENSDTPWDRGGPAPGLVDFLKNHPISGRVLVPGCGFGSDLPNLAAAGASEVVGLDIAPAAVRQAQGRLQGELKVHVEVGDLFLLSAGPWVGTFDWVWEHTCYCAIDPSRRPDYVESVAAALKPGGYLLAVFYLNPWDEGEDQRQGPPFGTSIEDLDDQFLDKFVLIKSWRPDSAFPGREGRELMRILQKK